MLEQRLNICLLTQEFPPHTNWGGIGVQFNDLARELSLAGHRVTVVSRSSRGAPEVERLDSGVEVWRVGLPLWRKRLIGRTLDRILHARAVATKVRQLDAENSFDIVEAPEAGLDGEVLATDPDFVDRLIISCHGSNMRGQSVGGILAPLHRLDWSWSIRRERAALSRVHTIVANSQATKREVLSHGLKTADVAIVYLGIDKERFHPGDRASHGHLEVGFVGRLQEAKGIEFVWSVMESLGPDAGVRFHLLGAIHPSGRGATLKRLRQFGSFARYHPPGSTGEMPDFYRSLDVLLVPSRFESFGLVYAEAMATGLLVFAGKGGAGPELVSDGETGFLVDPDGSPDTVVDRLRVLASDRSAFAEIRDRARESVGRRFTIQDSTLAKLAVYYRVSGAHSRGSR